MASDVPQLAAGRAPVRGPEGPEQGTDRRALRRRAGAGVAALERDDPRFPGQVRRCAALAPTELPVAGCLKDTGARPLPYLHDSIVPQIRANKRVLIVAHGNSLWALIKYMNDVSESDIFGTNIPTGMPLVYELDDSLEARGRYSIGGPQEVARAGAGLPRTRRPRCRAAHSSRCFGRPCDAARSAPFGRRGTSRQLVEFPYIIWRSSRYMGAEWKSNCLIAVTIPIPGSILAFPPVARGRALAHHPRWASSTATRENRHARVPR